MAAGTGAAPTLANDAGNSSIVPAAPLPPELEVPEERWKPVLALPCQLTLDLAVPDFTVKDLLRLRIGSLITTAWHVSREVPLRINGTLVGWSQFDVVGQKLAVRVTELL